ncbi:hypothetical protein AAFF_G00362430 [Aldrovandia affinis]|uniref:Cytosolic carboxypeptidase 2 n=1 Tax=Aldrovandia affinis TaxID=143900 RepID=A0AAD7WNW4_9TELE|nr:hypothetical protein AAFF_G00362430 [Aldrovandia affinis]
MEAQDDSSGTNPMVPLPATGVDEAGERVSLPLERALRSRQLLFDPDRGYSFPRLKEPQRLYTTLSLTSPHQGVCWPIECQVIKEEIRHIEWEPPEPELFYQPTGYENMPLPSGAEKGTVVYLIHPATKVSYFTRARVGGSRERITNRTSCTSGWEDPVLEFESQFESGNLQKAVHIGLYDYELSLRTDLYTTKNTQWFYFRVRNMKVGVTYRFTIVNLMKSSSLYSLGMKPLLYSEQTAQAQGVGWHRAGTDIKYYCNQTQHEGHALYSLTWTCQFPCEGDTCYFAHCYPYTYSDLRRYLSGVTSDPITAAHCRLRVLCHSLAGNAVYVLTITSHSTSREAGQAKPAVVVTARVHPGETNSSWMMQGLIDFLLGDSADARLLRDTFVFKVVPMLNPDGVVVGNYRCSLAGRDLNRNYRTLLRDAFPCVWHTRNMVKRVMAEREVVLYCDFHGHSRKNNVFMYGCENRSTTAPRLSERVFPLMMSKSVSDKFSYRSCKFRVKKSKEGTGRIAMWKLGVANSYTMEATFGGSTLGNRRGTHFTTQDLKSLGYCFCDTLLDYCDPDPTKASRCLAELGAILRQEIHQKLGRDLDLDGSLSDISDLESSTSGSNSTESNGLPVHLLNIVDKEIMCKKKHLKTRKERNRLRQERVLSNKAKINQQIIKHPLPVLSSEEAATTGNQVVAAVSDSKKEKKDLHLELVTATYLDFGTPIDSAHPPITNSADKPDLDGRLCRRHQLRSFSSLPHRQTLHRQQLTVTAIQQSSSYQSCGSIPASHPLIRRSSAASQLVKCRLFPVFVSPLELLPPGPSRSSVRPTHRPKPCQETKVELARVSIMYNTPQVFSVSADSMEPIRTSQERDGTAGPISVKDLDHSHGGCVSYSAANKHAMDTHPILQDLRKPDLSRDLRSRRLSPMASLKAGEMAHALPWVPSAGPLPLESFCPQHPRLQRVQNMTLTKATKLPPRRSMTAKAYAENSPGGLI